MQHTARVYDFPGDKANETYSQAGIEVRSNTSHLLHLQQKGLCRHLKQEAETFIKGGVFEQETEILTAKRARHTFEHRLKQHVK